MTIGLTYYWPNVSGLSIYAKNLAEGLTENNIKVTVICGKNDNKEKELEIINKVTVKRISGIRIGKGIFLPFYFLKIINIVRKTDVVICQLPSIECLCLAFWAKIFKKKLISTYHCQFNIKNIYLNKIIDFIQIIICKMSDKIVVNSKEYIESIGILRNLNKKIVEIYPIIK